MLSWPGALKFLPTRHLHPLACRVPHEERGGGVAGGIVMTPQGGYTEIREPAHRAVPPSADPAGPDSLAGLTPGSPERS